MESKSKEYLAEVEANRLFFPVNFEMTDLAKPIIQEVEITPEISIILGMPVLANHMRVNAKSISFLGKLYNSNRPEPVATLEDARVTATKYQNPNGRYEVRVYLEYFITSHGFHSDGLRQALIFKNRDGGVLYTRDFQYDMVWFKCGWNRVYRQHTFLDTTYVSWFDLWEGITHKVDGFSLPC